MEGNANMKQVKSILNIRKFVLALFANCLICLVVFWLFLFSFVHASTYYVRTDGNDDCNGLTDIGGTTDNCAFRTIQKGIQTALGGDNVIVRMGNYTNETLASVRSGSSGNLITIEAATGETVSIARITIDHNYHVIKGFTVSSPVAAGAIQLNGNYNQALYNTILGNNRADSNMSNGFGIIGNYNIISYNTLDGQNNGENTSFTVGFDFGGDYNEVTYNLVKDTNSIERVFEMNGNYNRIAYNEVRNVKWTIGDASHPDIFQVWGTEGGHDWIVENNYFHDFEGQVGNLGIDGNDAGWYNWVFRNNVFANIIMEFFIYFPIELYNNTFYRVTTINTCTIFQTAYRNGAVKLRNNAFIECGCSENNGFYNSGEDADYNFVSNTATGGTKNYFNEPHGINGGNPQLISYNNNCTVNTCDFNIQSSSVLINKGVAISGISTDYVGTSRPQGLGWDIGAFEYSGVKIPLPPSLYLK